MCDSIKSHDSRTGSFMSQHQLFETESNKIRTDFATKSTTKHEMLRFIFLLLLVTIDSLGQQSEDLDKRKKEACRRGLTITAASRAQNSSTFYIYEEHHAWLYNAKEQALEDYIDVLEATGQKKITSAYAVLNCTQEHVLELNHTTISIEDRTYEFVDIRNFSQWEFVPNEFELQDIKDEFGFDTKTTVVDYDTVGSACYRRVGQRRMFINHFYYDNDLIQLCRRGEGCRTKHGNKKLFHPFERDQQLSETKESIDALAFEHGLNRDNVGVLYVSGGKVHYWREDDPDTAWSDIELFQLFGCSSHQKYVTIALLVFVLLIAIVTVVVLVVLVRRGNSSHENTHVAARSSAALVKVNVNKGQGKKGKQMK